MAAPDAAPTIGRPSEIPTLRRLVVTQQETYAGRARSTYGLAAYGGRPTLN
jgi:hypothetical protein